LILGLQRYECFVNLQKYFAKFSKILTNLDEYS
jgi:hypothetical protein